MTKFGKLGFSAQEMFDLAYKGVMTQGRSSIAQLYPEGDFVCAYLGEDGSRCAAGHVLAKAFEETEAFDEHSGSISTVLCELGVYPADDVSGDEVSLLSSMQAAHDMAHKEWKNGPGKFTELYAKKMSDIAMNFGLEVPAL